MKKILVLNGPLLDTLGTRQPEVYGTTTLSDIYESIAKQCAELGLDPHFVQSVSETELIDAIASFKPDGIIVNPAAFTHFSYRLADALHASGVPVIEVHLSNIHAREPYRRLSVISPIAKAVIAGAGAPGYNYAVSLLARII
ncbi:MAG: type II 3-dehydroquinate dehydratase [Actinomycetota bacterium]